MFGFQHDVILQIRSGLWFSVVHVTLWTGGLCLDLCGGVFQCQNDFNNVLRVFCTGSLFAKFGGLNLLDPKDN